MPAHAVATANHHEPEFKPRGLEINRIEAFSDVVFGFALTLLVVSLEVPRSYDELMDVLHGAPAFAASFAILLQFWYYHYVFFRRYALQDMFTIMVNSLMLFLVVFYVYPLKFIFNLVFGQGRHTASIEPGQVGTLMMFYAAGFALLYVLLGLLYWNALRKAVPLQLDRREIFETRASLAQFVGMVSVGLCVTLAAALLPSHLAGAAGFGFFLIPVMMSVFGARFGAARRVQFGG